MLSVLFTLLVAFGMVAAIYVMVDIINNLPLKEDKNVQMEHQLCDLFEKHWQDAKSIDICHQFGY
jgi:hypothetical protein